MDATALVVASSIRGLHPHCLRSKQGLQAQARPSDLSSPRRRPSGTDFRLFLLLLFRGFPFLWQYCNTWVKILQSQLEEERNRRVEAEERMNAQQEQMAQMFQLIQSLGTHTGFQIPPTLSVPPPPPVIDPLSTPVSVHDFRS